MRNLSSVASITEPIDGSTLTTALINGDEFETVKTLKSRIVVGKKGTGEGAVTVQVIGDSLTHGGFFRHAPSPFVSLPVRSAPRRRQRPS